jgi:hypothetical protein
VAALIRFDFDGNTLDPHATPNDYEMVVGDILDTFIFSTLKQINTKKPNKFHLMKKSQINSFRYIYIYIKIH